VIRPELTNWYRFGDPLPSNFAELEARRADVGEADEALVEGGVPGREEKAVVDRAFQRSRTMRPAIGYIRVSTAKQGRSGLGIEAQQEALQRFAEGYRFAETFTEVESGKHGEDHRPALAEALQRARKERAPIIVAKLDRLSRDEHYISGLMKHRVPFIVSELDATLTRFCSIFTPPWQRRSAG
jgi:Resolvase, N terminal domain